jgi:5-methylcytosine-specific restriction endonuclease McrA
MRDRLSNKQKKELRKQLYKRDGTKCHYCGIEEKDFRTIWGKTFYGGIKRGRILEIDCKDNSGRHDMAHCVLACALCNMAKSDKFHYEEFKKVGSVIREIWQTREARLRRSKSRKSLRGAKPLLKNYLPLPLDKGKGIKGIGF